MEEEKGGWKGRQEVKRWADDTGWGGSSGLNEACERAAKAASHFSAHFFNTLPRNLDILSLHVLR